MADNNEIIRLQRQLLDYTTCLFNEGYLDIQFTELQQLGIANNPDFVVNAVSNFLEDARRVLNDLTTIFNQQTTDFGMAEVYIYQLKGSSSSIGAQRVHMTVITLLSCCLQRNIDGCRNSLQQVNNEYHLVRTKLETLFQLEQQLVAAGGLI